MSRNSSGALIGGGGRADGMAQHYQHDLPIAYQPDAPWVESAQREAELQLLLREMVKATARHCLLDVGFEQRSPEESQFLSDCIRDRYAPTATTLARLLNIQRRGEVKHFMSSQVRAIEAKAMRTMPWCPLEASRIEEATNGPLNIAQDWFLEERTAVRAIHCAELAERQEYASGILAVAMHQEAKRLS